MSKQVIVTMKDELTGEDVYRTICATNISITDDSGCWVIAPTREQQEELLKEWITDRAEAQHDTLLELVDFSIF